MEIALTAVGLLMIAATLLPLIRSDEWWIRIFDFPRIQITLIAATVFIATLIFYPPFFSDSSSGLAPKIFLLALAACLAYQCYMMFPYTPLARRQVEQSERAHEEGSRISLLFSNVLMTNREADGLKEIVRRADPDVILLVEADGWWQEEMKEFERTHPHVVHQPQDNTYGMLLYSKLELVEPEIKFLIQDDIPSIHARAKLPSGQEVALYCVHPRPPFPTEDDRSTERDAEILVVGKASKQRDEPAVVFGDLNDVAWSRTNNLFQSVSGLLDPRVGRGFYNTFHARYPFIRFPLDHFFHSNHFRLINFERLPYYGSDHFPVFIALSYEPDAEAKQEEPRADASEHEEAAEKIAKAQEA